MSCVTRSPIRITSNINKSAVLAEIDTIISAGNTIYHIDTKFSLRQIGKEKDLYNFQYAYPTIVISNLNSSTIYTFVVSSHFHCSALFRVNSDRD